MRILILGAGGIGGYFGGRLAAAGVDVTFLVRPARAAALRAGGLVLKSPHGDVTQPVALLEAAVPGFDAVLLTCKSYDLEAAIAAIAPAVGPATLVAPMLNGMGHLDRLDEAFGAARVLGGLAGIGVTLGPAGEVVHLNRAHRLAIGARAPGQAGAAAALHATLARGGFEAVLEPDIIQAMWEKWCLLATLAGMSCLMRAPVGAIVAATEGAALMREALAEVAAIAAAAGHAPRPGPLTQTEAMLTAAGSPANASMMRDLEAGGRTEHAHVIGDLLARARRAGLPAPLLRVALAHLEAAAARRGG